MQSKILRIILVSFICFPLAGEENSSNLCAEGYIEEEGEYCVRNLYKPADRRKAFLLSAGLYKFLTQYSPSSSIYPSAHKLEEFSSPAKGKQIKLTKIILKIFDCIKIIGFVKNC